jgi:hypothetical protein
VVMFVHAAMLACADVGIIATSCRSRHNRIGLVT